MSIPTAPLSVIHVTSTANSITRSTATATATATVDAAIGVRRLLLFPLLSPQPPRRHLVLVLLLVVVLLLLVAISIIHVVVMVVNVVVNVVVNMVVNMVVDMVVRGGRLAFERRRHVSFTLPGTIIGLERAHLNEQLRQQPPTLHVLVQP